jgi:opacity protein-like surface antigen
MKKAMLLLIIGISSMASFAQSNEEKEKQKPLYGGGDFELGMRSSGSFFNDAGGAGMGVGGQFRLRVVKRINTEWYADFFTVNVGDIATRKDMHIGWSVMIYPFNADKVKGKFNPYIIVGHCFDGARVYENNNPSNEARKLSTAVQMGLGTSYNITNNFDLTLTAQYMNHFGKRLHSRIEGEGFSRTLIIEENKKVDLEGHLLITLSLNVKLFDLWK